MRVPLQRNCRPCGSSFEIASRAAVGAANALGLGWLAPAVAEV
ncbi:MAG TPA: hypothetical protein P5137_07255 [Candidatus Brocadiia bacterium]|nr:hypothetical protein [Candidatus Brocadiia bacterium]